MKTWVKVSVTALFAVPAMALGKVIWPPAPGGPGAIGGTVPLLHLACGVRGFDVRPGHLLPPLRVRSPAAGCRRDVEGLGDLPERRLVPGLLVAHDLHPQR